MNKVARTKIKHTIVFSTLVEILFPLLEVCFLSDVFDGFTLGVGQGGGRSSGLIFNGCATARQGGKFWEQVVSNRLGFHISVEEDRRYEPLYGGRVWDPDQMVIVSLKSSHGS